MLFGMCGHDLAGQHDFGFILGSQRVNFVTPTFSMT
jgi:hypothetical protein